METGASTVPIADPCAALAALIADIRSHNPAADVHAGEFDPYRVRVQIGPFSPAVDNLPMIADIAQRLGLLEYRHSWGGGRWHLSFSGEWRDWPGLRAEVACYSMGRIIPVPDAPTNPLAAVA